MNEKGKKLTKSAKDILFAVLIAVFIRTFIVQAYRIPTGSMEPTLLPGDFILVNRLAYGLRIPYKGYVIRWSEVKRGDVIVFVYPKDRTKDFVKRVIGLGGETIQIIDNQIYINGRKIEDPWGYFSGFPADILSECPHSNFGPFKIPEGYVFVMGDNRDESNDSRCWGVVPENDIKGKVFLIYFSWDPVEKKIRFERLFHVVR